MDVREGEYLAHLVDTLEELREPGPHASRCSSWRRRDETLVRRYHETRRRHPLAGEGNVLDGIRAERKALAHLREIADRIIDTTGAHRAPAQGPPGRVLRRPGGRGAR